MKFPFRKASHDYHLGTPCPAIVTKVYSDSAVALKFFPPPEFTCLTSTDVNTAVLGTDVVLGKSHGCWIWPPFVQPKAEEPAKPAKKADPK